MLGEEVPSRGAWKAPMILSLLLGLAALLTLPRLLHKEETAIDMFSVPKASAMTQSIPSQRAWQLARAPQFRQPMRARAEPDAEAESPLARRDMMAKSAAALGLGVAASQDQAAMAAVAGGAKPAGKDLGGGGQFVGFLGPVAAASWALFNIAGPGLGQLDNMQAKADAREGKAPKRAPPPKAAPKRAPPPPKKAAPPKKEGGGFSLPFR